MLLLRVEVTIALTILKRVATRFAAVKGGKKLCFTIYCISNSPAGKLTRLSLIAIQVVCNIYNTMMQPGRSHGLVCVHALYYIMLLEKSGVLQIYQNCSAREYNSIPQTDLAIKKIFPCSQTIILAPFKFKTFAPSKTCIGKCD